MLLPHLLRIERLITKLAKMEIQVQQGSSRRAPPRSSNKNSWMADSKGPASLSWAYGCFLDSAFSKPESGKLPRRPELCTGRPIVKVKIDIIEIEGLLDRGSSRTLLAAYNFY